MQGGGNLAVFLHSSLVLNGRVFLSTQEVYNDNDNAVWIFPNIIDKASLFIHQTVIKNGVHCH